MRYILLILLAVSFSFCNNTTTEKEATALDSTSPSANDTLTTPDEKSVDGCYVLILKRDTMVLHFQNERSVLMGKLTFDNYEKDGSSGAVEGNLEGDLVKLTYSFASEGMNSVMDVYFKVDGDKLFRGIGDMETKGDTAYFTNPEKVQYPSENFFLRTPCEKVSAKYRM